MTAKLHERSVMSTIVLGGLLEPFGMASFAEEFCEQDVIAIQAYIISEAQAVATR